LQKINVLSLEGKSDGVTDYYYTGAGTSYDPVSVCLCLTVTRRCSNETAARIDLVFGTGASFDLSYTVL